MRKKIQADSPPRRRPHIIAITWRSTSSSVGEALHQQRRKWAAAGKRLLSSSSDTPHHRNHLADFSELKNVYCAVRHGESLANVEGIISCEPDADSGYFHGLSPKGKEQVKELGSKLLSLIPDIESRRVFIYASDFRRARDTSRAIPSGLWAAAESVVVSFPEYIPALRERSFGPDLNLGSDARYKEVWWTRRRRRTGAAAWRAWRPCSRYRTGRRNS